MNLYEKKNYVRVTQTNDYELVHLTLVCPDKHLNCKTLKISMVKMRKLSDLF